MDIDKIEKIMRLFDAKYLYGICSLDATEMLDYNYFFSDDKVETNYIVKGKQRQLILKVPAKFLREFLKIAQIFNTTLEGYIGNECENIVNIMRELKNKDMFFIINDNDGSSIQFNKEKYDYKDMISKIERIIEGNA